MKNKIFGLAFAFLFSFLFFACSGNSYFEDSSTENTDYIEADAGSEADTDSEAGADSGDTKSSNIFVYVTGAVRNPGVYELKNHSRVFEAVELAGGMTEDADSGSLNLAKEVLDEEVIRVYREGELEDTGEKNPDLRIADALSSQDDGRVNINTATKDELLTLPGIGEQKAEAIIEYRNENGSFKKPEDIKNIPGIKDGVFNKIKDSIKAGD